MTACASCTGGRQFRDGVHTGPHLDGPDGQPLRELPRQVWPWVRPVFAFQHRCDPDLTWGFERAALRDYFRPRIMRADERSRQLAERRRVIASAVAGLLSPQHLLGHSYDDMVNMLTVGDFSPGPVFHRCTSTRDGVEYEFWSYGSDHVRCPDDDDFMSYASQYMLAVPDPFLYGD